MSKAGPRFRVLVVLGLIGTGLFAGCGSDDKPSGTAENGPIKIGVLAPLTGPLAIVGKDQVDGMRLFLQENPEVADRKLELVVEDTAGDPQAAVTKTRKLLTSDKVDVVSGVISSGELGAVKDQIASRDVPLVVTNAGLDAFTAEPSATGFRVSHANSQNNKVLGWYAHDKLGYKKVAVLATDFTAGVEHTDAFRAVFEQRGGTVIAELNPPLGAADYAPFISRIPKDADAVYVFIVGADAVKFWTQAKALGLTKRVPIIGPGFVADDLILSVVGDAADGFVGALHYVNTIDTPENQRFVSAYRALTDRPADQFASDAYTGIQAIAEALEATGGELGEPFLDALAKVRFEAPRGEVYLDRNHQAVLTVRVYEVREGKPVVIDEIPDVTQDWQPQG